MNIEYIYYPAISSLSLLSPCAIHWCSRSNKMFISYPYYASTDPHIRLLAIDPIIPYTITYKYRQYSSIIYIISRAPFSWQISIILQENVISKSINHPTWHRHKSWLFKVSKKSARNHIKYNIFPFSKKMQVLLFTKINFQMLKFWSLLQHQWINPYCTQHTLFWANWANIIVADALAPGALLYSHNIHLLRQVHPYLPLGGFHLPGVSFTNMV